MPRYMFHDIDGRSGRDPALHLGNMGIALSTGRSTSAGSNSNKDEYDEFTEDYVAGERLPVTGTNLSHQAGRSGVDPALRDTDSGKVYQPRDVGGDDYPPMTGRGNSLRVGKPSDSHKIVDTWPNPAGSKYAYYSEVAPGEWKLFRSQPAKANSAELVKTYSTKSGKLFYQIQRHRDAVDILCTNRQLLDPGWRNGIGEMPKSPSTADRKHVEAREEHTRDSLQRINEANRAYYKQGGGVPRRKPGAQR